MSEQTEAPVDGQRPLDVLLSYTDNGDVGS